MTIEVGTVAGAFNLFIQKGSDFEQVFTFSGENFAGWDARAQIRATKDAASTIAEFTVGSGITLGTDTVTLELGNVATAAIAEDSGVWDLELINPSSKVIRIIQGSVTMDKEVTR